MFISKLQLKDFKSHPETTITLDKLTIIRSPNATGKSSIEQAIQLSFAGRADGTTKDGKGSIGLIRKGATKGFVKMLIDDDRAKRLIKTDLNGASKNTAIVDPTAEQWAGGEQYAEWLKDNRETLSCIINNRHFVDLDEDTQKDVLSAILLPKTYAWPDWVLPAANALSLKINWQLTPFEIIEQGYKAAYKERETVNREVKNFKMPEGDTSKAASHDDIATRLDGRKKELETAVANLAAANATFAQGDSVRSAAQTRHNEAGQRIQREEATVSRLEGTLLSAAVLKKAQEAAKGTAKVAKLDADIASAGIELKIKKSQFADLNKVSAGATCPTCKNLITEELIASLAVPLKAEIERLHEMETTAIAERKKLGDPVAAAKQVSDHEQAQRDIDAAKGRATHDQGILKDAKAALDKLGTATTVPSWTVDEENISKLRESVQKGSQMLAESKASKDLLERIAKAKDEKDELIKKQDSVGRLVRYFEDEVKAELLAESIGPFAEKMNAVLANWGYTCQISIEPYVFALMFRNENGTVPIELKHLSKSQRYRFATAFQVALAVATGFKFVVVDEGDIFYGEVRGKLFKALMSGELDQAIVLVTDDRTVVPAKEDAPNAIFWMLENSSADGEIPNTTARQLV